MKTSGFLRTIVAVVLVTINVGVIEPSFAQTLNPEVIWAMPKSARIKCVTTTPGKMRVEYGITSALGMTSTPEMRDWPDTDVTRHYVILKGLQPNTQYYYRVRIALQGGGELVSDIRTFKTFRAFSHVLPTVRYSSYIIGSDWSVNDTSAPYHDWNALHYDVHIAYAFQHAHVVKSYNPNAALIRYDNITNNYAGSWREQNMHWMQWADEQGISYEHIAMHYAVNTEVNVGTYVEDRPFTRDAGLWVSLNASAGNMSTLHNAGYKITNRAGEFLAVGLSLRFDIMYFNIIAPASGGFDGVWEYCNGVDAEGKPASWAPLNIVEDTTVVGGQKFARSGYVRFVPPKERTEWVRAMIWENGVNRWRDPWRRNFWVRFRVTQAGASAPEFERNSSTCIMNEDFARSTGTAGVEVIPGWDTSWETNPANNGDPEYNPNPPSSGGPGVAKSARFKWWSRVWYYKPENKRFLTNVFDSYYQQWLSQAWMDYIFQSTPALDGWYCDNYTWNTAPGPAINPSTTNLIEMGTFDKKQYAMGMGELMEKCSTYLTRLGKISVANNLISIAPGDEWHKPLLTSEPERLWVYFAPGLANREITMQLGQSYAGSTISSLNTFFAEQSFRADKGNYHVPMYAYTYSTKAVNNTEDWWFREKLFALALYLLVKDTENEYLYLNAWHQNFYYGEFLTDPNSSLHRYYIAGIPKQKAYYIDAAMYDFGVPVTTVNPPYTQWVAYPGSWRPGIIPGLFVIHYTNQAPNYDSNGNFLGNNAQVWYFARRYTRALVVLRTGSTRTTILDDRSKNESTEFDLGGNYLRLRADGTLDPVPISRLNLRAQEAAILIPTDQPPPSNPDVQITVSADKTNPRPLDVVTITITARNNGSSEARNVQIQHNIPSEATYVLGSLKVNGNTVSDPADRTKIGVTVPSIPAGGRATVQFQMVIR